MARSTRNSFLCLAGAAGLAIAAITLAGQRPQAAETLNRNDVQNVIREYLTAHPDVVVDALQAYQDNQQEIEAKKFKETVASRADDIRDPALPFAGNPDADVTVVEFFDYNCGYCKRAVSEVSRLVESDKNVKVIFHEMPILADSSNDAARYALASNKQGKYFEYHQALMKYSGAKTDDALESVARGIGLDVEQLRKDANSQEIKDKVAASLALSRDLGIHGTPAFIIGDTLEPGYMTYENMKDVIDQIRNDKG